jgi:hypothetical protein
MIVRRHIQFNSQGGADRPWLFLCQFGLLVSLEPVDHREEERA